MEATPVFSIPGIVCTSAAVKRSVRHERRYLAGCCAWSLLLLEPVHALYIMMMTSYNMFRTNVVSGPGMPGMRAMRSAVRDRMLLPISNQHGSHTYHLKTLPAYNDSSDGKSAQQLASALIVSTVLASLAVDRTCKEMSWTVFSLPSGFLRIFQCWTSCSCRKEALFLAAAQHACITMTCGVCAAMP